MRRKTKDREEDRQIASKLREDLPKLLNLMAASKKRQQSGHKYPDWREQLKT